MLFPFLRLKKVLPKSGEFRNPAAFGAQSNTGKGFFSEDNTANQRYPFRIVLSLLI